MMRLWFVAGYTAPTAPPAYSQPVQGYGTAAYDTSTATVTTTQASYAAPSAYGTQPAYPAYGQQPPAAVPPRYRVFLSSPQAVCCPADMPNGTAA